MVNWAFGRQRIRTDVALTIAIKKPLVKYDRIESRRISVTKLSFDMSISTIFLLFHAVPEPYNQHR